VVHKVDGFDLKITSRRSWKAERRYAGKVVDVVPVTWTKGRHTDPETGEILQEVWYQDPEEMKARNNSDEPFVVAIAKAKDYSSTPHEFAHFCALFEVAPTGRVLSENSIETRVIQRARSA